MKIRADTNNPNKVPEVGTLFVVTKVQKIAIWYNVELSSVEPDLFNISQWERYITEQTKIRQPFGNLCYPEHRRSLAEKIVEHIKALLEVKP